MKIRLICLLLISALALTLFSACETVSENNNSSSVSSQETTSGDGIPDFYTIALDCIENGDYEQAYTQLYMIKGEERAQKLLRQFEILLKKETNPKLENGFVEYTYDEFGGLVKQTDKPYEIKNYYDEQNRRVKIEWLDSEGNVFYVNVLGYDEKGHLILDEKNNHKTFEYTKHTWEYDDDDRLVKETSDGHDPEMIFESGTTTYYYNENGLLETKLFDNGQTNPDVYTYEYYENGLLKGEVVKKGMFTDYAEAFDYEYDENGNLIKKVHRKGSDGSFQTFTWEYEYDSQSRLVREYKLTGSVGREYYDETRYTYDENGDLVEKYNDTTSSRTNYYYQYNAKGQLVKETTQPFSGYKTVVTYEYDLHDNIIKKMIYEEELDETTVVEYQYQYFFIPQE